MNYTVLLEAHIQQQINIEADSPEHAAQLAMQMCANSQAMQVDLRPTWLETAERAEATGELSMGVLGRCALCEAGLVDRDVPGQPWTYATRGINSEDLVCYACGKDKGGARGPSR